MKKKKVMISLGVFLFLLIAGMIAASIYTEQPEFCNSCHLMKPYYKAWKESPHKMVKCLDCHYEPNLKSHLWGKINGLAQVMDYTLGRYSEKPVARIPDTSCLRSGCHRKEKIINTKIMFKGKVKFQHATHWRDFDELGKGVHLRCATCHKWLTYDKHLAVDENTCLICHFKNVSVEQISKQCSTCHTEIKDRADHKEFLQDGTASCADCHTTIKTTNAPVLKQMCYFCHADKEKLDKIKDRELLHRRHITEKKAECINCHELIQHGKES
ncbi:MAG: NapC/NirT family cytochrome c [Candidatus Omnitrophota bacterium]|nr:NapC/NirT family cytochrome c [Candidatus Omnitrophota bacterium]